MDELTTDPIWYPFTQMKLSDAPIHIESAKGSTLYAADGKQYIDAVSSWWVNIHGHANPIIAKAIAEQALTMEHVIFAGFTHTPAVQLAQNLVQILPSSIRKIFYSDNGSTAVEVAIKMAIQYWHNQGIQKTRIIAFENAYHGDTFGAMSVGAKSAFNAAFEDYLFDVVHLPVPDDHNIDQVKEKFQTVSAKGDVAAFIFEPLVQGAGGMLMHKAKHLDALLKIAHSNQVLCIADEVMTGFGRTGKNFAVEHLEQQPDIMCLSKGITGGFMPLGVTACSQDVFDAFYSDEKKKALFHGHSYTANPLACSAANASLKLLLDAKCQSSIQRIVDSHTRFAISIRMHDTVKEVRQQGTIIAIEIQTPEDSSYFNTIRDRIYKFCLDEGVLLRPLGNILYIMPPYSITKEELETTYEAIRKVINHFKTT